VPRVQRKKTVTPVWAGPSDEGPTGGITQSMIASWLCCRERFRLRTVHGLDTKDAYDHKVEYGQMWHLCEEEWTRTNGQHDDWIMALLEYSKKLVATYPMAREQIQHWYSVCKTQFPLYVEYWKSHDRSKDRTPLLQEQVFHVPYQLPCGATVWLRGKWDSVDVEGKGKSAGIYLQENKSKGNPDEMKLRRQLQFDLQTMFYYVALQIELTRSSDFALEGKIVKYLNTPLKGIRYNVIRRPLSGGKGSIRKLQPTKSNPQGESDEEYYGRLGGIIKEDPGYYFMRWKVELINQDIDKFKQQFLNPVLKEICRWWAWVSSSEGIKDPYSGKCKFELVSHYRFPYGVYNPLIEKIGFTDLDEHLDTGSELGLVRGKPLFRELV
jgi:hypothetical protein